ncbi:MAG: heme o synthase [Sporichthyaceae bacterium]
MTTLDLPTSAPQVRAPGRRGPLATLKAYVALTKPRIIELLLVTTVPVMFLAERGVPDLDLVLWTLLGGIAAAGSANVLNCYLDRDIDADMRRTRRRPLPMHGVSPRETVVFGVVLGIAATLVLGLAVNWLSAWLALGANLFYVFGYTMILKRRTSQNIVWGGAAGCFPPLIGWTAVTNEVSWAPIVLFGVVFFWTPPHFWALAMRYKEDYAAAKVPMLPVVATERRVITEITIYTWATVACSLALWPVADTGWLYPVAAAVFGAGILFEAHRLLHRVTHGVSGVELAPMRLFHMSNSYLALLFLVIAVDAVAFA